MEWLTKFPEMDRNGLREFKKTVDNTFTSFSRNYGEGIESFFDPLLSFLVGFEKLFLNTPWPITIFTILSICWLASRSILIVSGTLLSFLLIGYFGMWEDTMSTLAIILVATLLCICIGIPIGIAMARSNKVQTLILPILDVMQTIPSFVYLIPVVMLLGIGKVPGLIAVCIYAIPPIVRLTNLGIRLVDKDILESCRILWCKLLAKIIWCTNTPCTTNNFCRSKSNYNDGSSYGCNCFNDWSSRIRTSCSKGNFKPVPCFRINEWSSNCCVSNNFR